MAGVKKQETWYQLDLFSKEIRVPSEHDGYWHDHIWGIKKERALAKEKKEEKVDLVNQPPHYKKNKVQAIKVIEAGLGDQGFQDFLLGQVFKYLLRFKHKGKPIEDLEKAEWYLKRLKKKVKMLYGNKSV
jgi:hypothetical protein